MRADTQTCASRQQFHEAVRDVEFSALISATGCVLCSYSVTDIKYSVD